MPLLSGFEPECNTVTVALLKRKMSRRYNLPAPTSKSREGSMLLAGLSFSDLYKLYQHLFCQLAKPQIKLLAFITDEGHSGLRSSFQLVCEIIMLANVGLAAKGGV